MYVTCHKLKGLSFSNTFCAELNTEKKTAKFTSLTHLGACVSITIKMGKEGLDSSFFLFIGNEQERNIYSPLTWEWDMRWEMMFTIYREQNKKSLVNMKDKKIHANIQAFVFFATGFYSVQVRERKAKRNQVFSSCSVGIANKNRKVVQP